MDTEPTPQTNDQTTDSLRTHPLNTEVHHHITWVVLAVLAVLVAVLVGWSIQQQQPAPAPVVPPTVIEEKPAAPRVYTKEELHAIMNTPLPEEEVSMYEQEALIETLNTPLPENEVHVYDEAVLQNNL